MADQFYYTLKHLFLFYFHKISLANYYPYLRDNLFDNIYLIKNNSINIHNNPILIYSANSYLGMINILYLFDLRKIPQDKLLSINYYLNSI